jgi:hypothetical protein
MVDKSFRTRDKDDGRKWKKKTKKKKLFTLNLGEFNRLLPVLRDKVRKSSRGHGKTNERSNVYLICYFSLYEKERK